MVQQVFQMKGKGAAGATVAGLLVQSGRMRNAGAHGGGQQQQQQQHHGPAHYMFRVLRDGSALIDEGPGLSSSLKRFKDTVHEASTTLINCSS